MRHSAVVAIISAHLAFWPSISAATAQTEVKTGSASVDLELGAGTTLKIDRPFGLVLIGNPSVIDFQAQGARSLLLKPVGIGSTNLVIIDKDGIVITNLRIVVHNAGPI